MALRFVVVSFTVLISFKFYRFGFSEGRDHSRRTPVRLTAQTLEVLTDSRDLFGTSGGYYTKVDDLGEESPFRSLAHTSSTAQCVCTL